MRKLVCSVVATFATFSANAGDNLTNEIALVESWLTAQRAIGGVYSLLWAGWGWVFGPDNMFVLLPGVVLVYLWQVILGVVMARYQEPVRQAAVEN